MCITLLVVAWRLHISLNSDVLSFYKEQLVGEKDNYIHNRALVTNKGVNDVLVDVINETIEAIDKVRVLLKGKKERETWETFLKSYTAFHYMAPRYKLTELLDGDTILC